MEEELKEKLFRQRKAGWQDTSESEKEEIFKISEKYMEYLNKAKTEREFIKQAKKLADENGFIYWGNAHRWLGGGRNSRKTCQRF